MKKETVWDIDKFNIFTKDDIKRLKEALNNLDSNPDYLLKKKLNRLRDEDLKDIQDNIF